MVLNQEILTPPFPTLGTAVIDGVLSYAKQNGFLSLLSFPPLPHRAFTLVAGNSTVC